MRKYNIYKEIMSMDITPEHRAFLDYVEPLCHVEASGTHQGGCVLKVIRDRKHIPILLEVSNCEGIDYIKCSDVDLFEPFNEYCIDLSEYEDLYIASEEEIMEMDLTNDMREHFLRYYGYIDDAEACEG